jgi:hypothetical protein
MLSSGSYTALSTKGVASLLSFTLWHVITFPVTYLLVTILVLSALMQIRYINRALQRFDSTQVIPIQFVLFTLNVILGSAILYRDFESATASQGTKFVGGCLLTFLGVYLITSGRASNEDESSEEGDEEEAVGLLQGDRYQDGVDLSPSGPDGRVYKPGTVTVEHTHESRSPRGSILSGSVDGNEDALRTPRGVLSPAASFRDGSLSDRPLSSSSRETVPSPPCPEPLTANPWAASPERNVKAAAVPDEEAPQTLPCTPPDQTSHEAQHPPLLLRFPAAPSTHERTPPHGDTETRQHGTPHTPQSQSTPRNSLSLRFTPAPLLPPLSSTSLSAVVAESLRRGEGSPGRHRRIKSPRRKRKSAAPTTEGDSHRDGADGDGETEYETETSVDDGHTRSSVAIMSTPGSSSRINSTPEIPTTRTVAAVADSTSDADDTTITRVRSMSDSFGGGLAWLGGTFRRHKRGIRSVALPTQIQSNTAAEDGERAAEQ